MLQVKIYLNRQITAKRSGKPQTKFGQLRQGIILATVWEVQFLSDPCLFVCIFLEKCL